MLRDTLRLALLGVLICVPVALAGAQLLASQLYEVRPYDPLAVSVAIATLAVAALAAGYVPARRAARVDPLVSLRGE